MIMRKSCCFFSQLTDFENLTTEYAQMERKLHLAVEDEKSLTEQLHLTKTELSNGYDSGAICCDSVFNPYFCSLQQKSKLDSNAAQLKEAQNQLQEKEQIIKELMEEGEKLSKQQLQTANHIKKLKEKQKELEKDNAQLK